MITSHSEINNKSQQLKLYRSLTNRVFHITSINNFHQIQSHGFIEHNKGKIFPSEFGYYSYFQSIGHISFCDFKNNTNKEDLWDAATKSYNIFDRHGGVNFVYLFLNSEYHKNLITWEKRTNNLKIIPYFESGYPGPLPIENIEEVLIINNNFTPH